MKGPNKERTRVAVVLGTRPELIKLAPVIHELRRHFEVQLDVIFTNQHREMLAGLVELFGLEGHRELELDYKAPNLTTLTAKVLDGLEQKLFSKETFDAVLVQGDTTTAFATALSCFYHQIPVAHIEAGLRTHDLKHPYPEEFNRQVISRLAHWHFCPTESSKRNLLEEKIDPSTVEVVGNTVIDALDYVVNHKIHTDYKSSILPSESPELHSVITHLASQAVKSLSLLTYHRRENQGSAQEKLFQEIRKILLQHPEHHMIYPYHLNPKVSDVAFRYLSGLPNCHLIRPLAYRPFLYILKQVDFVLSDSGGLQEELPSLKKPLFVLRDVTERPEVIEAGLARLIGTEPQSLRKAFLETIASLEQKKTPAWYNLKAPNPFGDGLSARRIVSRLLLDLKVPLRRPKAA